MITLTQLLSGWFQENRRVLPFRQTLDPYRIWVSEIIMQQTRINQGLPYYERFVERFPDIRTLASADESEVMKMWQGLGYYSRARNMISASHQILTDFAGKFPDNFPDLITIKGIGRYTAAAIASICFKQPVPVVDGNVLRLIARLYGIRDSVQNPSGYRKVWEIAANIMDKENPGDFNQAMMEFGALVCKPQNPLCDDCVLRNHCVAFKEDLTEIIPLRDKKSGLKERYLNYLVISVTSTYEKKYFMRLRKGADIWKNLYEFPLAETDQPLPPDELLNSEVWTEMFRENMVPPACLPREVVHKLTHRKLIIRFFVIELTQPEIFVFHPGYQLYTLKEAFQLAVPKPIEQYLKGLDTGL